MSGLFDKTTDGLAASLNFRLIRNNVTSANIANAETPGYKAQKVDFLTFILLDLSKIKSWTLVRLDFRFKFN